MISELAHEFKNPMVTIKTVSQGIERLATDKQGRQQIARLTGARCIYTVQPGGRAEFPPVALPGGGQLALAGINASAGSARLMVESAAGAATSSTSGMKP